MNDTEIVEEIVEIINDSEEDRFGADNDANALHEIIALLALEGRFE